MSQSDSEEHHDHTEIKGLLEWMDDPENDYEHTDAIVDGPHPLPHYWTSFEEAVGKGAGFEKWKDALISRQDLRDRSEDIVRSLDAHYFKSQLHQWIILRSKKNLTCDGWACMGLTSVVLDEDEDEYKILIQVDFKKHTSNKDLLETILHEMAHAWIMVHGNEVRVDNCEKSDCKLRLGVTGHGQHWLLLARRLELRAESLHKKPFGMGRVLAAAEEIVEFERSLGEELQSQLHAMLKIELGWKDYERAVRDSALLSEQEIDLRMKMLD